MFTPRRSRLSLVAVPPATLTLSHDGTVNHEYEDFILMDKVENVPFTHWTAHLRYFWGWYSEEPNFACAESDFPSSLSDLAPSCGRR